MLQKLHLKEQFKKLHKLQKIQLKTKQLIKSLQQVNQKKKKQQEQQQKKTEEIYIPPEKGQQIIYDLR